LVTQLGNHLAPALVRIASSTGEGHHRCLDVASIGFSAENEEVGDNLVIEIATESWDMSLAPVIRHDDPSAVPNPEPYLDPNYTPPSPVAA